jgi:lipoyl(octanoyl) transferase
MKQFRLLRSGKASASFNMALDETILSSRMQGGMSTLRVYRWENPSFSVGISSDPQSALDLKKCSDDGVTLVRRMTGGGVLFHDDEITYSFACAKEEIGEARDVLVSYREICGFLKLFYELLGLSASFACQEKGFEYRSLPHYMCSASHEKYDLVIGSKKIGGNAQKRARDFVFQHGSIPLSLDWERMNGYFFEGVPDLGAEVTSLDRELSAVPGKDSLETALIRAFSEYFDVRFVEEGLSAKEEETLRRLEKEKYENQEWNIRKLRRPQASLA